tara:strand:+ start:1999 stop:2643 length:645 start_codon:yes stop_codon:yes gene_type:complete
MNRQNYFLGGIINDVVKGVGEFVGSAVTGVSDFVGDIFSSDAALDTGLDFAAEESGVYDPIFSLEQAGETLREGISNLSFGFLTPEDIKSGAGLLVKEGASRALGAKRASSSQQQARAMRSQVLGAGRGIGVSGSAPARQFAPGSVRSMIARTNAGRQAFQPGTVDTRQNVVNIISDAFAQTSATTPTGAGRISPSSSKIAKVGTSYFKGKDTV